jgi:hypothetical protein
MLFSSVYAITAKNRIFPCIAAGIMAAQWAIAIYAMSQSSQGTDQVALLLSRELPPLPPLPTIDPYHGTICHLYSQSFLKYSVKITVCIFISVLTVYVQANIWVAVINLHQRSLCKGILVSLSRIRYTGIHGHNLCDREIVESLPIHAVDASNSTRRDSLFFCSV